MTEYWSNYKVTGRPAFANQEPFLQCLAVTAPTIRLAGNEGNPLTIHLLVANEALLELAGYLQDRTAAVRRSLEQFQKTDGPVGPVSLATNFTQSGSALVSYSPSTDLSYAGRAGGGAFVKKVPLDEDFRKIRAYLHISMFFTEYTTILDRLAREIGFLFPPSKRPKNWTWGTLFNNISVSGKLSLDPGLVSILTKFNTSLIKQKTADYRHVLTHQGYMRFHVVFDNSVREYCVLLPVDPDDPSSVCNVPAIHFMGAEFNALIQLCDQVYGHLLNRAMASAPPW